MTQTTFVLNYSEQKISLKLNNQVITENVFATESDRLRSSLGVLANSIFRFRIVPLVLSFRRPFLHPRFFSLRVRVSCKEVCLSAEFPSFSGELGRNCCPTKVTWPEFYNKPKWSDYRIQPGISPPRRNFDGTELFGNCAAIICFYIKLVSRQKG